MKLHSLVMMAALVAPVFCQEPLANPVPAPTTKPSPFADQALRDQALSEKADQMALRAGKKTTDAQDLLSDRAIELDEQMYKMAAEFDSGKIAAIEAQAAAAADQFSNIPDLDSKLAEMEAAAAKMTDKISGIPDLNSKLSQFNFQFDSKEFSDMAAEAAGLADQVNMAFLQAPQPAPPAAPMSPRGPSPKALTDMRGRTADREYDAGTRALDQQRYDEALQHYDNVIFTKSSRSDGALYWKAYALNRLGKRDEALASIAQLRRDYASSGYLNDAQALETEVKQNAGQPVSPNQESNDDIKLLAINSLMDADPERAIPLVENMLKGSAAPKVKDNALFVLAHSKSPRAQQVLGDFAKGAGNPDLQLRAIQYVGMTRTKEAQQQLAAIYTSSSDTRVKGGLIEALRMSQANDALLNIAKTEKDAALRAQAINGLASNKSVSAEGLAELYTVSDSQSKRQIIDGLTGRRDAKTLIDLARKETDPAIKRTLVEHIGSMHDNKDAMDYMIELVK